ncbi:hypothetical protein [Streptomyces werraensis]|uniref:hypothetical protein n=1 Tax=Streptomyces werraensis TaxID=68284 RepID=UPI00342B6500
MTSMDDVVAQFLSIFVSAVGLVVFRLIAKYLPEDPAPVPRPKEPAPEDDSDGADDTAL